MAKALPTPDLKPDSQHWKPLWLLTPIYVLGWFLCYQLSAYFAVLPEASIWFLPAGWTVAFVLIVGWRGWLLSILGPLLTGLIFDISLTGLVERFPLDFRHALFYGGAAIVLRYRLGVDLPLRSLRHLSRFVVVTFAAGLGSAVVASAIFWIRSPFDGSKLLEMLLAFWIGDAAGVVLLTPVIVTLFMARGREGWVEVARIRSHPVWFALRLVLVLMLVWLVFALAQSHGLGAQLIYLTILPVIWIAVVDGPYGVMIAVIAINIDIVFAVRYYGMSQSLLELQIVVLILTTAGYLLSAAIMDRDLAMALVRDHERLLQQQVEERTLALTSAIQALHQEVLERKQAELEASRARDAAEDASLTKSQFLANMSHEIRTPLNAIIGMTGLLLESKLAPDQAELAGTVRSSGESLLTIINDILDFSKIEAGKLELEMIDFDLPLVIEEALDSLASRLRERELELVYLIDTEVPPTVQGDPGRLRQVLLNLAGNAIKFTERGEVVIRVVRIAESADSVTLRFSVSDTGIGVPRGRRSRLFESFSQVDISTTRKYGGTGLGLAICKQLSELMGGRIGFESKQGKGSTFWFTVVLRTGPEPWQPLQIPHELQGKRVLTMIGCTAVREILGAYLGSWGLTQSAAASGELGLAMVRAAAEPYHVVLIDQLPDMEAAALSRALRAEPAAEHAQLVLLGFTGTSGSAEPERLDIAAFLPKPVRPSRLFAVLVSLLADGADDDRDRQPATEVTDGTAVTEDRTGKRILIAEDNPVNQRLLLLLLERIGCSAEVVANGASAVEALRRRFYDLVLMDCQMPEMDGYEATAEIRRIEDGSRHTPIVAITAYAMKDDRQRCLEAGMDDYITKPIQAGKLAEVVKRWL